ncbi:hypothetical protein ATANTOWER_009203 [Ataeniobius toweri]|uniref:Uncharacterized protein n=1 Tax=Ataeniobius toweri TaxID=208326 RepID=A0ABU7C2E1_9TELE|nr:hypothetical protein [Ataeniobius toweri]
MLLSVRPSYCQCHTDGKGKKYFQYFNVAGYLSCTSKTSCNHPSLLRLNAVIFVLVFVVFSFIWDRVAGAADSVETPRLPSPQTPPPAHQGGAQSFPRPANRHSPSSVSWAVPWASSWWDVPGTPPERGV